MAVELSFSLFDNAYQLQDVANPTPLKAGKFKFTEDGLYSEQIFGPLKNFRCSCGELFSREKAGLRCEKCNVLCDNNSLRGSTFSRIDLPANIYVLLPIFRTLISSIFGQTAIKSVFDPNKYEGNKANPYYYSLTQNKLVKSNMFKKDEKRFLQKVYDIPSLYKLYKKILKNKTFSNIILDHVVDPKITEYVFVNFILVSPPDSRPLIQLNKQYQAHPITAAYTEILKNIKNSFLDKIFQANPEDFGLTIFKYQASVNKLYATITDKAFQRKESIVRESLAGKTVETSQRAVIVPEPTLRPGNLALHEETVKKIFQPEILHFLNNEYDKQQSEKDYSITDFVQNVHTQTNQNGNVIMSRELFSNFLHEKGNSLTMIMERPPVLYKYNMGNYNLGFVYLDNGHIGYKQHRVVGVNSQNAPMFNFDFDGDNVSVYGLSSKQAKRDFHYGYVENSIEFEHNRNLIPSPEHESIYSAYMLSVMANKKTIFQSYDIESWESFDDFEVQIDTMNQTPGRIVMINDIKMPYNVAVINKALNCNKIIYDGTYLLNKKNVNKLLKLLRAEVKDKKFAVAMWNFDKFLLECSTIIQYCNPTFSLDDFAIGSDDITNYKKTLINEPYIAFHQNDILFNDYVIPKVHEKSDNILALVSDSGARIKNVQLQKAAGNNGIPTNIYGKAFQENQKSSLLDGLTKREFYMGGDSARLALAQRQEAIPKGGELQRKFYFATGFLRLDEIDDCGTNKGFTFKILNKTHLNSLYSRFYMDSTQIDTDDETLINTVVTLRSPIYCKSKNYKVCTKCFGSKKPQSAALGASIGAYIPEAIIQSVLRTHHFSGAFITHIDKKLIKVIKKLRFESPNRIYYDNEQDIKDLESIMHVYYKDDTSAIEFVKQDDYYILEQNELPFNDDSVKQLNNIVGMIDKNRDSDTLISIEEMYNFLLDNIVIPNGMLSIYIELVISILYYDEDDTMIRYSDKEPVKQIALKKVIDHLDPKLAIFHNFSNSAINRIYTNKKNENLDHMYFDLISCYQ